MNESIPVLLLIIGLLVLILIIIAACFYGVVKGGLLKTNNGEPLDLAEGVAPLEVHSVELEPYDSASLRSRIAADLTAYESELRSGVEDRAQKLVLESMSRSAVSIAADATTDLVAIPSEDIKGKIIGRDGKNIRAFEQVTGVDLLVDEQPGGVLVSCFDLLRRAIAKRTLEGLIADGRIQPAKIEEIFAKSKRELESEIDELGRSAAKEAKVDGLPPKVVSMLGRLAYRLSLGQNVLAHSIEVAQIAGTIAAELGFDADAARKAGLLHDIGKALGPEYTEPHALAGMRFLKECGLKEPILNAVGAHHNEIVPASPEAELVIIADSISASRPGARSEPLETYLQRVTEFESIAKGFAGVYEVYAVHGGREIRVIVAPESRDDLGARELASMIANRIELDAAPPMPVKVTVIREFRASASTRDPAAG